MLLSKTASPDRCDSARTDSREYAIFHRPFSNLSLPRRHRRANGTPVALFDPRSSIFYLLSSTIDGRSPSSHRSPPMPNIVHNVFFTLNDNSAQACQKLVDSCEKH